MWFQRRNIYPWLEIGKDTHFSCEFFDVYVLTPTNCLVYFYEWRVDGGVKREKLHFPVVPDIVRNTRVD